MILKCKMSWILGRKEGPAVRRRVYNAPAPAEEAKTEGVFKVGDKVCVELPIEALKEVQRGHGGWSMSMSDVSTYKYKLLVSLIVTNSLLMRVTPIRFLV